MLGGLCSVRAHFFHLLQTTRTENAGTRKMLYSRLEASVGERCSPSVSITATVENDTIKLPAGIHVPDGTKVEIMLPTDPAASGNSFYEAAREYIGIFDGPADLS